MTDQELRLRALDMYLSCSRVVDQALRYLLPALPASGKAEAVSQERTARRECGMLFRHWASREIWDRVEQDKDATQMNLELLRLFTNGFKLPKDGSGLRYAELSTQEEELREFWHRLTHALGVEETRLLAMIERAADEWKQAVMQAAERMLTQPIAVIEAEVREWTQSLKPSQGVIPGEDLP